MVCKAYSVNYLALYGRSFLGFPEMLVRSLVREVSRALEQLGLWAATAEPAPWSRGATTAQPSRCSAEPLRPRARPRTGSCPCNGSQCTLTLGWPPLTAPREGHVQQRRPSTSTNKRRKLLKQKKPADFCLRMLLVTFFMPWGPPLAVRSVDPFSGECLNAQGKQNKNQWEDERNWLYPVIKNWRGKTCDVATCAPH